MGWLDRWREARAEAAVRRQLAALERGRGIDSIDVQPVVDLGLPPVDVNDPSTWPADYVDGPRRSWPPTHLDPRIIGNAEGNTRQRDRDRAAARRKLLAECARVDAIAGMHGGFVTTKRIRELLGVDE
jgi:hypothetical protein